MQLTADQQRRYERNLLIPGFGAAGQVRLAESRVLIVGIGGLGSAAALYLAAAGVGRLGLMDSDAVEISNLQRQVLHTTDRLGQPKTRSAVQTLGALNPEVATDPIQERLTPDNAHRIIRDYHVVVEACDNFEAKYLINDTCVELRKPFATAGILSWSGQALFVVPGRTCCLRCVVPEIPAGVPTTSEQGVMGPVPGILGSLEALEAIRWLAGFWDAPALGAGLLHSIDGLAMRLHTMPIPRRPGCRCGLDSPQGAKLDG